jgi:hypothetical protein
VVQKITLFNSIAIKLNITALKSSRLTPAYTRCLKKLHHSSNKKFVWSLKAEKFEQQSRPSGFWFEAR